MRRFASFIQGKRPDKADTQPAAAPIPSPLPVAASTSTSTLPRASSRRLPGRPDKKRSTELPPHVRLDRAPPSSSSTTSESPSLLTPADSDGSHSMRMPTNGSWRHMFKGKKQQSTPSGLPEEWVSQWRPDGPGVVQIRSPPESQTMLPVTSSINDHADDSDETASTISSEDDVPLALSRRLSTAPPSSRARAYLHAMTLNAAHTPPSLPPTLVLPNDPCFPRSSNPFKTIHPRPTLEMGIHRKAILRHVAPGEPLSPTDEASIASFGLRPPLTLLQPEIKRADDVETITKDVKQISLVSVGLAKWVQRPCFEERATVWLPLPGSGEIICTRVPGNNRAVAALEFSEGLQALSGMIEADTNDVRDTTEEPPQSASSTTSSAFDFLTPPESPSEPVTQRPAMLPVTATIPPIPSSPTSIKTSVSMSTIKAIDSKTTAESGAPRTIRKRGVHFAEPEPTQGLREKDGKVPTGYADYTKKQKEEKARFLREEQERRAQEAPQPIRGRAEQRNVDARVLWQLEEQRRLLEEERRKLDEERRAWEMQKRAEEEERKIRQEARETAKKRQYADEVAAARTRREEHRKGQHISPHTPVAPRRQASESHYLSAHSRPAYDDSRRMVSESNLYPRDSREHSPAGGSSRERSAESLHGSVFGSTPGSSHYSATSYNGSTDDITRNVKATRRASTVSTASMQGAMQWGLPQQAFLPPMPVFPVDMPLLPPNAPFMHQSSRRSGSSSRNASPSSPNGSPLSRPVSLPQSHSTESVNRDRSNPRPRLSHLQTWNGSDRGEMPTSAPANMLTHHDRRSSRIPSMPPVPPSPSTPSGRPSDTTTHISTPIRAPSASSRISPATMPARRRTFGI